MKGLNFHQTVENVFKLKQMGVKALKRIPQVYQSHLATYLFH
jgi:hypothetical protein